MKRRNAETGKMRRPLKRTKCVEGMYGNSLLYLKFVMVWATVVMADYMLEFRFEFIWPFWMMLRSVYDSFKYQGLAFSVFFICIALTSDMICYCFIPLQYIFFAASTYVWVQYVWYTFADKGVCVPTVAICCILVYVEGLWRGSRGGGEFCRPLAAHCVGYPVVTLGFGAKALIAHRLRQRRQRQVRAMNELYFQLMRDALPESALDQSQQQVPAKEASTVANGVADSPTGATAPVAQVSQSHATAQSDARHMNGSVRRRCVKAQEQNGHCVQEHAQLQAKLEKLEKHLSSQTVVRDKSQSQAYSSPLANGAVSHTLANGSCHSPPDDHTPDKHEHTTKGGAKNPKSEKKEANTLKEERKKNKNRDKDKENIDNHKNTEHTKEQIIKDKDVESTKDVIKIKDYNSNKDKEKEQRDRDKEMKEKERERERERERDQRTARECVEELKRVRAELTTARASEAEAKRALAAAAAAERQRKAEHTQLKQAHAALQQRVTAWRTGERAALERRLGEERRARAQAESQLLRARVQPRTPSGECENDTCKSRRQACENEMVVLSRDLQRSRERQHQLQLELTHATEQVRSLEARQEQQLHHHQQQQQQQQVAVGGGSGWQAHLERALSAETRVKLDLLSALGDAKRNLQIQEAVISRQEKEIEELKAQMLAVMPTEYVSTTTCRVSKLRLSDGSPLDPNASIYTPKQLAPGSDA